MAKIERAFLVPTDYSPAVKPTARKDDRVFELRTYTASPGNLAALNARFRDHTMKLFEKHGMTNLWYWTPAPDQKGGGRDAGLLAGAQVGRGAGQVVRGVPQGPGLGESPGGVRAEGRRLADGQGRGPVGADEADRLLADQVSVGARSVSEGLRPRPSLTLRAPTE